MKTMVIAIVTAVSCFGLIKLAQADELRSTLGEPIVETLHHVSCVDEGAFTRLVVTRSFQNDGLRNDEVQLRFETLGKGSIIRLEIFEEGKWVEAKLETAGFAKATYKRKISKAGQRSFLLTEYYAHDYELLVSLLKPKETIIVRYVVDVKMDYEKGAFSFLITEKPSDPNLSAIQLSSQSTMFLDGRKVAPNTTQYVVANPCERYGLDKNCGIASVDVHNLDDRLSFVARVEPETQFLYGLVAPDGEYSVQSYNGKTSTKSWVEWSVPLPSQLGKWTLLVSSWGPTFISEIRVEDQNGKFLYANPSLLKLKKSKKGTRVHFLKANRKGELYRGSATISSGTQSVRAAFAPEKWSKEPQSAHMIFLVDASYSQGEKGLFRQLDLVNSMSKLVEDRTIDILVYNRKVELHRLGKRSNIGPFLEGLKKTQSVENGSNLKEALLKANQISQEVDPRSSVYIFALTDLLLKKSASVKNYERALKKLPPRVIMHILDVQFSYETRVSRDDQNFLNGLPKIHNGVSAMVWVPSRVEENSQTRKVLRYLIRPTRLEKLSGSPSVSYFVLEEGEGIFEILDGKFPSSVHGLLWNKEFSFRTKTISTERVARHIFRQSSDSEEWAKKGNLVSAYTSFVQAGKAHIPPPRPTYGLQRRSVRQPNVGRSCLGYRPRVRVDPPTPFPLSYFGPMLRACASLRTAKSKDSVVFETAEFEIVSVQNSKDDYIKCVEEGIWKTRLPTTVKTGKYKLLLGSQTYDVTRIPNL